MSLLSFALSSDTTIVAPKTFTLGSDAAVVAPKTFTLGSDAVVVAPKTMTLDSDAYIVHDKFLILHSDAVIHIVQQLELTSDAVIVPPVTFTLDSDAVIVPPVTFTLTSDAVIHRIVQFELLSDAWVKGRIPAIQFINGHVLLPERTNWREEPDWERRWQTEISSGLLGNETRAGLRSSPRRALSWTVSPWDLPENSHFDDRIRAARKAGLACAPFSGLASVLDADVDHLTVVLTEASAWDWAVGDFMFFRDEPDFEAIEVAAVDEDGTTLTLLHPVSRTYAAGLQIWPLLFGKLLCDEMEAIVSQRGEARLTIQELRNPSSTASINEVDLGSGIGSMIIGDTFTLVA